MPIDVVDAGGITRTIQTPNTNGRAAASASAPTAMANEDLAAVNAIATAVGLTTTAVNAVTTAANATTAAAGATTTAVGGTTTAVGTTNTRVGDVTETVPASDTASSGLNGRLQRIAQRLTALIAQLPATLGIKTAANSLSIAPASDAVFAVTMAAPATGGATAANQTSELTQLGAVTETAPATDTASSGLNGRLQRIAQRFSTLLGIVATEATLGTLVTATNSTNALLGTPATFLPPQPVSANLADLTGAVLAVTATGETSVIAAAGASLRTRVHRMILSSSAATVLKIRDGAGGTVLLELCFGGAGAMAIFDFDSRAYFATTANTALIFDQSGTARITGRISHAPGA